MIWGNCLDDLATDNASSFMLEEERVRETQATRAYICDGMFEARLLLFHRRLRVFHDPYHFFHLVISMERTLLQSLFHSGCFAEFILVQEQLG